MRSIIVVIALIISVGAFAQEQPLPQLAPQPRSQRVVAHTGDGQSVAKFFLTTCIAAVDDPAAIEVVAHETGWVRLPPPLVPSGVRLPRSAWRVDGFFVTMWAPGDDSGNPDVPACFVGMRPSREVKLDEFVECDFRLVGVEAFQGGDEGFAFSSGDV
jgi:hypothetical protein